MRKGANKTIWAISLVCWVIGPAAKSSASDLDARVVESWVSTNRFFLDIKLEVSRNYFLSDQDTNFTIEPAESAFVEGALLPNSFYVKYDEKSYREKIIQGISDSDCWAIDVGRKMIMSGSKYSAFGGAATNWTWIATHKQENRLRDFTQFGLLYVQPGSLQIEGTNFTATATMTASPVPIEGWFSAVDEKGIPHAFNYHFKDVRKFSFDGKFDYLNVETAQFNCVVSCWVDNILQKKIRLKTVDTLQQAGEAESKKNFRPTDFLQAKTTLVESNHVRYELLPSGKLSFYNPEATQAQSQERQQSTARFVILCLMVFSTLIFLFVIISSQKRNSPNKQ